MAAWRAEESAASDRFAAKPENQQRIKTVMPEAVSLLAESYGITGQLQHLQNTQPILNSNLGMQILLDAISYRMPRSACSAPKPVSRCPAPRPCPGTL